MRPRRIRAVGEFEMPLDTAAAETVVFVIQRKMNAAGELVAQPLGTGFVVEVVTADAPTLPYFYVVTAAHCVRGKTDTAIRVPDVAHGNPPVDRDVDRWFYHPDPAVDVAVTLFRMDSPRRVRPIGLAVPDPPHELQLGDRVYFLGLLDQIPTMFDSVVPMVRSGTLGAVYQEGIRAGFTSGQVVVGHLIDSRSIGGFSGSPCWVQQEFAIRQGDAVGTRRTTMLLGMILGHLPAEGIAVVTPLEHIAETIMTNDELVADRKARAAAYNKERAESGVAVVPDAIPGFTREDFMRDLTKVTRPVEESGQESS